MCLETVETETVSTITQTCLLPVCSPDGRLVTGNMLLDQLVSNWRVTGLIPTSPPVSVNIRLLLVTVSLSMTAVDLLMLLHLTLSYSVMSGGISSNNNTRADTTLRKVAFLMVQPVMLCIISTFIYFKA